MLMCAQEEHDPCQNTFEKEHRATKVSFVRESSEDSFLTTWHGITGLSQFSKRKIAQWRVRCEEGPNLSLNFLLFVLYLPNRILKELLSFKQALREVGAARLAPSVS